MENYSIKITDDFLKYYRLLEQIERDDPRRFDIIKRQNESLFALFRSIRNNLSHNTTNNLDYPVLVSSDTLKSLQRVVDLLNVKAIDRAIKTEKVLYVKEGSTFKTVIKIMSERNVSHLPIFDRYFRVKGVISESSIIDIISTNENFNQDMKVIDYISNFDLVNNQNERYIFMRENAYFSEAKALFDERYKNRKRLGLIFITKDGTKDSKVLGILSAYSVLGD
ncbi:MAG: CBS domain-containing protein [Gammaproteobacteria bacterium]|nr:CBS domain-containing protein [Gammaproteobacteria bacterium]